MSHKEQIKKYLEGKLSEKDTKILFQSLNHEDLKNLEETFKNIWMETKPPKDKKILNSSELLKKIKEKAMGPHQVYLQERKKKTKQWTYRFAAVLIGFILISSLFLIFYRSGYQEYHTTFGETRQITLPDQSVVLLNSNSTLRFRNDQDNAFQNGIREVWLTGEAFFSVTHKPENQKFIVHSKGISIEVLGTQFNVNNRRGETKVMLESGRVKLTTNQADKTDVFMNPGELAVFSETIKNISVRQVNSAPYTSWMDNELIFDDTPLQSIIYMLEDNYGYKVINEGVLVENKNFSGSVPSDQINLLFKKLSVLYNINITIENEVVTLKKEE